MVTSTSYVLNAWDVIENFTFPMFTLRALRHFQKQITKKLNKIACWLIGLLRIAMQMKQAIVIEIWGRATNNQNCS